MQKWEDARVFVELALSIDQHFSGYVDEVIYPEQTRVKLIKALDTLQNKRDRMPEKKHDNLPL